MIPWVGGKGKLMWLINKFAPNGYDRFIDVFGGSATVTLNRPPKKGCMEVYNDYNSNLTNLFFCVKERPMALIRELGFLPLNSRDDFNVLEKFFNREEFTEDYLKEELELTQVYLDPPQAEAIKLLMAERSRLGDVRRAADYFKLVRYSFSGGGKAFAGRSCDIRQFFYLIWENSRRLARVIIENKDCVGVIVQYDRSGALIYCDPPYYEAEGCYAVVFTRTDHIRLHDTLLKCQGFVMVSYGSVCDPDECPYEDMDRPDVELSNAVRREMGIPLDAKLQIFPDEGEALVCAADYKHDITDVPENVRPLLEMAGICAGKLDELIRNEQEVWHG